MKWFSSIFLATVILVPSSAQLRESLVAKDQLDATTVILRSANNVDKAIAQFSVELNADQPDCFDNDYNYIKCYDLPDDIWETRFMAHKEIPAGTKMKALKDNFGFEFGFAQIDSVRDILMGCEDVGSFALVPFAWPGGPAEIGTSSVLVKDFIADDGNRYYCMTGPLSYDPPEE